jgi:hypothetical protein
MGAHLVVSKVEIHSAKVISEEVVHGVFIHRRLNMPKECYSREVVNEGEIFLRMRAKMGRERHLEMLEQKKKLYNDNNFEYSRFYFDTYDNFVKHEKLRRVLVEVNALIAGKLVSNLGETCLPLKTGSPITSHFMQVETIEVPVRPVEERSLVTDIDHYMVGNPHIL